MAGVGLTEEVENLRLEIIRLTQVRRREERRAGVRLVLAGAGPD